MLSLKGESCHCGPVCEIRGVFSALITGLLWDEEPFHEVPRMPRSLTFKTPVPLWVDMTSNKETVQKLNQCFTRQDWHGMLPYLAEDVVREEVGAPELIRGKDAFEKNMVPGPEVESMRSEIVRMVEEGNVVVSEGTVLLKKKDGAKLDIRFCDVFEFEHGKVKRQTAYTAVV